MANTLASSDKTAQLRQIEEQIQYELKGTYDPGSRLVYVTYFFAAGAILSLLYFAWRVIFYPEDMVNYAITARLASLSLAIILGCVTLLITPKAKLATATKASNELLIMLAQTEFRAELALDRLVLSLKTKGSVTIEEVLTLIACEQDQPALDKEGAARLIAQGTPNYASVLARSEFGAEKIDYSAALK